MRSILRGWVNGWRVRVVVALAIGLSGTGGESAEIHPHRDPVDQPFRFAPMRAASQSLWVPLGEGIHLGFDVARARTHTVWGGPGLDLYGPPYSRTKQPFIAVPSGTVLWGTPPWVPWAKGTVDKSQIAEAPLVRFKAVNQERNGTAIEYTISLPGHPSIRIEEKPYAVLVNEVPVVVREFEVGPCSEPLEFLAHAEMGKGRVAGNGAVIARESDRLLAVLQEHSGESVQWRLLQGPVEYDVEVITEEGTEKGWEREHVHGDQARLYVQIPASSGTRQFAIASAVITDSEGLERVALQLRSKLERPKESGIQAAPRVHSGIEKPIRESGDEFYRIEHFPVPPEIELLVGGMDWLPNGDLAVCTWTGEIYIVENAQGNVGGAVYRRFARGLNEPLGLRVHQGDIYVVQKNGLYRVRDIDEDGIADQYENVNSPWGYTGNYHAYAFGPAIDSQGQFYAFVTGQRGRWDVPYLGWCLNLGKGGRDLEPFCDGLRVPNGWAIFGPKEDLFVTDNQGNWIGACKLNHLQEGKFYGFPSSYPTPEADPRLGKEFAAPALWFPRRLSPSASDIAVVTDERFGPFEGQMMVGDFQNAIVMRVFLERVSGEWQGAVWPFAKGFLSAVNRLSYGPDGKLYVGGCKRTWAAATPLEYSLDRVSFTGRVPFEISKVEAESDGFSLSFTQPVASEDALDPDNYAVSQFRYVYHASYGSPEIDHEGKEGSASDLEITKVEASPDGMRVRLFVEGLRTGYVTEISAGAVLSEAGEFLRNDPCFYTLNAKP